MNEIVSVIVPVYNAEKYLEKSIESIRNQTYSFLEIIIVDDGSEDRSFQISKNMQEEDSRIICVKKENGGPSSARNEGLKKATGKYVLFCDADDIMEEVIIEYLLGNMTENGIGICGYFTMNENGILLEGCHQTCDTEEQIDAEELQKYLFSLSEKPYQGFLWNKLFSMDIIKKYQLTFDEKIWCNEDRLFILQYLLHIKQGFYSDKKLYRYRLHGHGLMGMAGAKSLTDKAWTEILAYRYMEKLADGREELKAGIIYDKYYSLYKMLDKECSQKYMLEIRNQMKAALKYILASDYIARKKKIIAVIKYEMRRWK